MISRQAWHDAAEQVTYWKAKGLTPNEAIKNVQPAAQSIYAGWETAEAIIATASQGMIDGKILENV
jgi:hypothetical protein